MNLSDTMIEAYALTRRYGEVLVVHHLDFSVRRGEVYGFLGLGPNGAASRHWFVPKNSGRMCRLTAHTILRHSTA
jgi:ABC-type lipopolysaccharide export system ATPase subunit